MPDGGYFHSRESKVWRSLRATFFPLMPSGPDPQKKPEMKGPPRQPPQGQQRPPQPPPRRALPPRPPPRPRRHHHRGKASHARIGLLCVFVLFRILDFVALHDIPPELSRGVLSTVITNALWTTALLIGIALRKSWARLILLGLLGLASIVILIMIPVAFDWPVLVPGFVAFFLVYAAIFAWLILSRDVRRLTSRERD